MSTDPNKLRTSPDIPLNLITPDEIDTQLGKLTFTDGAPSSDTIQKILDNYDFTRALQVYMDAHQGASIAAFFKGFREIGAEDGDIIIFSELMDSQTLFLTPNADTVYYVSAVNLADGPMVFESPPDALGVIDDAWFGHIIDFCTNQDRSAEIGPAEVGRTEITPAQVNLAEIDTAQVRAEEIGHFTLLPRRGDDLHHLFPG